MRRLRVLVPLLGLSLVLVFAAPAPADEELTFPESHKDFLGGASYAALFGLDAGPGEPGPHSSDTGTGRPPRVGPNLQVNDPQLFFPAGLIGRSETSIAASGDGKYLVAGWNDADGFCGPPFGVPCTPPPVPGLSGYGWSADGGRTWTDGGAPFVIGSAPGVITVGDPSLDVGGRGNDTFYYANLGLFDSGPFPPTAGVTVHSGSFTGNTFSWNNATLIQAANFPRDFLDKEHIAADKRGNSNDVHVAVTNFIEVSGIPFFGFGQIEVYTSTDGAASFGPVSIVQPDETISLLPVPFGSGVINQGSQPAVGPKGNVYVAWERGWLFPFSGGGVSPEIRVATSTDAGASWSPVVPAGSPSGASLVGTLVSKICSGALFSHRPDITGKRRMTSRGSPLLTVDPIGAASMWRTRIAESPMAAIRIPAVCSEIRTPTST